MSACPYDDSMSNPLQYLGSRQALADLANFHTHAGKLRLLPRTCAFLLRHSLWLSIRH